MLLATKSNPGKLQVIQVAFSRFAKSIIFLPLSTYAVCNPHHNREVLLADYSYQPWHELHQSIDGIRLRDPFRSLTGQQFAAEVDIIAHQLKSLGVGPGDVVATFLPNRLELVTTMCAAWRLRASATPMNPTFAPPESAYQIEDSGAKIVVTTNEFAARKPEEYFPGARIVPLAELAASAEHPHHGEPDNSGEQPTPDDIALIVYTSGSTGRPKGVLLSHKNINAMVASITEGFGMDQTFHALMPLPLFHCNAILVSFLAPYSRGGSVTILDRFDPEEFIDAVAEFRPTYFSAVPAIFAYLLQLPPDSGVDFSSLQYAVCGAAPASIQLIEAFQEKYGVKIRGAYGLTEGTVGSTAVRLDDDPPSGTVGRALPHQDVRISDGKGGFLPTGESGEVVIKGDNVMVGYLNRPEETAKAVVDGWLHTGDVGYLDENGFLFLVDRIKDMIIRGGENLYPSEIEAALNTSSAVVESAVVGLPHDVLGEVPVAYVSNSDPASVDASALMDHVRPLLAKVKWPVHVEIVGDLPRNPIGKVDKPRLREMAKERFLVET